MKIVELGTVCEFENGDRGKNYPSRSAFIDIGIPFISAGNLTNNQIDEENLNYISEKRYNLLNSGKLKPNDILFCLRGSLGKYAINSNNIKGAIASSLVLLRAKNGLDQKYLSYFLRSSKVKVLIKKSDNGSSQPNLSATSVKKFKIPLPPLPEQKRIAAILDAADAYRQQTQALIRKYEELGQSLFLEMFGDPVRNEMGWERKDIKELCSEIVDCVNKTAPSVEFKTEFKMIRTPNIRNYKVNLKKIRFVTEDVFNKWNRRLVPKRGDIVFTREAPAGEAGIIEFDDKVFLGQRTMIFRVDHTKADNYYILYQLMGNDIQRQISKLGMGSTVKHLSVPACKKFKILSPPLSIQNKFAERIQKIEAQKALANQSLAQAEDLFQSLLQQAFNGKLKS